ncbi:YdcP family protein [Actinokineospora sp. UTMC 2448]|uniref:YdcP family protein n=1 Tax=Actinokineospora sp. UTMC 2448 TaxID=2268449 RepID=UPI0021642757|nr:YdcP family protein [Actinokineospora sp. UTMC 2448]UVS78383.1 hypothetical protein Actkin_02116 [Actinokineospora sp. UTMC 2448]
MRNIPVLLENFKFQVVEAPTTKMTEKDGRQSVAVDKQTGATLFVVALFAKPLPDPETGRAGKGEEIKVTLETDPGDEIVEGMRVELINPRITFWENEGRSGLAWRASGVTPATAVRAAA